MDCPVPKYQNTSTTHYHRSDEQLEKKGDETPPRSLLGRDGSVVRTMTLIAVRAAGGGRWECAAYVKGEWVR